MARVDEDQIPGSVRVDSTCWNMIKVVQSSNVNHVVNASFRVVLTEHIILKWRILFCQIGVSCCAESSRIYSCWKGWSVLAGGNLRESRIWDGEGADRIEPDDVRLGGNCRIRRVCYNLTRFHYQLDVVVDAGYVKRAVIVQANSHLQRIICGTCNWSQTEVVSLKAESIIGCTCGRLRNASPIFRHYTVIASTTQRNSILVSVVCAGPIFRGDVLRHRRSKQYSCGHVSSTHRS